MAAFGTLFPLDMSALTGGPRFKTDIIVGRNGQEVRNALWQDALWVFNAAFTVRKYEDIETLNEFFLNCYGKEKSFLVKDFQDYDIPRTNIGTGTGVATTFQLVKKYVQAVIGTYERTITKPKQLEGVGGVRVWVNNVELDPADYSFSSSTGIITIPSAPANGHAVEASCDEFYVPVRFDVDEIPIQLLTYWVDSGGNDVGLIQVPEIPLVEVRSE